MLTRRCILIHVYWIWFLISILKYCHWHAHKTWQFCNEVFLLQICMFDGLDRNYIIHFDSRCMSSVFVKWIIMQNLLWQAGFEGSHCVSIICCISVAGHPPRLIQVKTFFTVFQGKVTTHWHLPLLMSTLLTSSDLHLLSWFPASLLLPVFPGKWRRGVFLSCV